MARGETARAALRSGDRPSERGAADPWPILPPGALDEEHVRPWLLRRSVRAHDRTGRASIWPNCGPAVALFSRFGGIDYDRTTEAGSEARVHIFAGCRRCWRGYEAALLQLTIGDKGSYFYAAFGAPLAHDDDRGARGDRRAGASRRCPPSWPGSATQIGISRGRMRTGAYGGATRRTYGVLGDEVNHGRAADGCGRTGPDLVSRAVADAVARNIRCS